MRYFQLFRKQDISGVSGVGVVAEGCEFHDGQIALSWYGQHHVIGIYPSLRDVLAIHGHEGATVARWLGVYPDNNKETK